MTTQAMRLEMDREIDLATAGSFPASDPPPWTLGATPLELPSSGPRSPAAVAPAAVDVVIAAGRGRSHVASIVELIVLVALIPVGLFLVAAPVLLAWWTISAATRWWLGH